MSQLPRWKQKRLALKYGLSSSEYLDMHEKQSGSCAICGREPRRDEKSLAVDHNHTTNTLRGLLCSRCNTGIGLFDDSIVLLEESVRYLKQYEKHPGKSIVRLDIGTLPRHNTFTDETREKMSRNHWTKRGTITHPMLGRKHTPTSLEKQLKTLASRSIYEWTAVSPIGETFTTRILRSFAREHNLCVDTICRHLSFTIPPPKDRGAEISDKRKNTTGWTFSRVSLQ